MTPDMNTKRLADLLISECRDVYNVDPYLLMALIIPKKELMKGVPWGAKLHSIVQSIIGEKGYVLSDVIRQVQQRFLNASPVPMSTSMVKGWKKQEVLTEISNNGITCPIVFQILNEKGKRRHVGFVSIQDALLGYIKIIMTSGCIQVMECPVPSVGNLTKFYVDVDCKLSRVSLSHQETLEMLMQMPETLGKIFVDLNVLHRTDRFCIMVKENSRLSADGDTKMSIHLIVNLASSIETFVTLQGMIRSYIRKKCPRCIELQEDDKLLVSNDDIQHMGIYASLAFADCHPEINAKQGLAGPWSRKSVEQTTVSTLREIIWVQNGQVVDRETGHPSIFIPYTANTGHPKNISAVDAACVIADTLVSVVGPRCGSFREGSIVAVPVFSKRKNPTSQRDVGFGALGAKKRPREDQQSLWPQLPSWFTTSCKQICKGTLPSLQTSLQHHISYPVGVTRTPDTVMFQFNANPLSICPRSLLRDIPCSDCHWHKSNGTVYLCSGQRVFVVCRDAECERLVKQHKIYLPSDDTVPLDTTPDLQSSSDTPRQISIDKKNWFKSCGRARYLWLELSPTIMDFIALVHVAS
jgi:hypothetical protein